MQQDVKVSSLNAQTRKSEPQMEELWRECSTSHKQNLSQITATTFFSYFFYSLTCGLGLRCAAIFLSTGQLFGEKEKQE